MTTNPTSVTGIDGTPEVILANYTNPYTGETITIDGVYNTTNTFFDGGPGDCDIFISGPQDSLFRVEDDQGNLLLTNFELFLTGAGSDILLFTSTTYLTGDLEIYASEDDDIVWTNEGNDYVEGNEGDDILNGGPGHDTLKGGEQNDMLTGASGNDILDGGINFDVAVYTGDFSNYSLSEINGTLTIHDAVGTDGTDTLVNIEKLIFSDGIYENGYFIPDTPDLTFTASDFESYTKQDGVSAVHTVTGNTELNLSGNAWKALDFDYVVTEDTYVTFDYKTVTDGEVQGLVFLRDGLDPADMSVNNLHEEGEFIRLDGIQAYNGTDNLYTEPNGTWQSITIKLSDYNAIGSEIDHLVFVNDDDAGIGGESAFRNIKVFESGFTGFLVPAPENAPDLTFTASDFESYTKQDGVSAVHTVTGNTELNLSGNAWKALDFDYVVTEDTYVTFDYKTVTDGEVQGLVFLRDGLDPADMSVNNLHEEGEFIRLDGIQAYNGTDNLYTEPNGTWQSITIKLSDYNAIGSEIDHLVFVNDDDAGIGGESAFRNIKVFESNGIYGDALDNIITGTSEADYLYGDGGADTFLFENLSAFDAVDVIADFDIGENDALDVSDLLSGYDPFTDLITDFVQITDNGTDSILSVDADGGADGFVQIATLQAVTGLTDEAALETAGNLITT